MEDEEYKKLPVEDRCVHKLWKARVNGYEEVTKLFRQIDDEKSTEFGKYLGLVKQFVVDTNALGQEKGLEATLAYIENYAHAGKTVSEVMTGIVMKCMAAPKSKTRELALQVTLMYIEIEKTEAVQEELLKGMNQKNPKIVSACISASTMALKEFGSKIINIKPLVKKLASLFADRDKTVRDEAKQLAVELYRWMGPVLRSLLNGLQPLQVSELEVEFTKLDGQKAVPVRYIRSQQQKHSDIAIEAEEIQGSEEEEEVDVPQIDSYDLADPVDILSKLPKDFYDKLEAKKWQDRKEALEVLENLVKTPKLENGDYGDLIRAIKKIIQKDSNVIVVASAGRCLAGLASGLKKRFQTYSGACVPALLEKFKEKKQNVVIAIREAIDAIYLTTTLEAILEDVLEALNNKNPAVKSETSSFLARAFTKTLPTTLNKKLLKVLCGALVKTVNEPDPNVRDCSSESLGTLMKLVGEKAIGPFLGELEKDHLKITRIRECSEKAIICVKIPIVKKEKALPPNKAVSKKVEAPKSASKVVKKAAAPKKRNEISSGTATVTRSKGAKVATKLTKPVERHLSDEEVDEVISSILSVALISDIISTNWKLRLSAAEQMLSEIQSSNAKDLPTQALVKFLTKKPGLKDTNFQVLKMKLDVIKYLAENSNFSTTTADCCIKDVCEKFGDPKNGQSACDAMTAIAEATSLSHVSTFVVDFSMDQKSPKVSQEVFVWLSNAILQFGFSNLNAKSLIENCKKALASSNPSVRQSAITLLGTMYLYMGPSLITLFDGEKAALREQIAAEFDKHEGEKPPAPSKGISKSESSSSLETMEDAEETEEETNNFNIQDIIPRVDISNQITEALLNELSDKNWKVRNEALTKISAIILEAKLIKPNIGDLPQALAQRLNDSNTKIAQISLNICEAIAKAMGAQAKQYIRALFPGFLQGLGDNKSWMRTAALDAINAFAEQCGYKEFFEGEMIGDALKSGSPVLRSELWVWLGEKLPKIPVKSIPREELLLCIPHLYSNLEDRNADVRKNAQEAILGIMMHTSYEAMVKQTEKLKPGSKNVVIQALDKVRPSLPVKPLPKKTLAVEKEDKAVRGTKPVGNAKNAVKSKSANSARPSTAVSRKKEDEIDTSPLLVINNMKHQRTIDESKLKVLKWNFTTPREEFVDLLKDQMGSANVNRTLIFNMFHSDFRYHLKAIECLTEDLATNTQALISNLDLVLKWLTLRFFDTNPSVLLKGLEYLTLVFQMLIERDYKMLENEASAFIPYLIVKIGDPKDTVRNGVRSLFKQIVFVYPLSRLFICLMEGVKSKNARQRAECLEVMGSLIEDYGVTICVPSPAACMKEIAKQISDRDNSVRNAALNCVVQAYYIVGEKVYKMVGNISDKDMSLLEERIKRANKRTIVKSPKNELNVMTPHSPQKELNSPVNNVNYNAQNESEEDNEKEDEDEEEDNLPAITLPPQVIQKTREVDGPFKLDPEFMKELDGVRIEISKGDLLEFDLDFLHEDIKVPSMTDDKAKIMPLSPPKPLATAENMSRITLGMPNSTQNSPTKQKPELESIIIQMNSTDLFVAVKAMDQMQAILNSSRRNLMIDYEDDFMKNLVQQLQYLGKLEIKHSSMVPKTYRAFLSVMEHFYTNKILGRHITIPVLKDMMHELLSLLASGKLEECTNGDSYVRAVNLHCVKLIERSDHTNSICALINLLQEILRKDKSLRMTELVMKCLWRVIKIMPSWGDELQYDCVLGEVHSFFKEFPPHWWNKSVSDTPLRTIKTIVHSSVKIRGSNILLDLEKVPDAKNSEVGSYVLRVLKGIKTDSAKQPQQMPVKAEITRRSLSRTTHNLLTEIFQKIGNKDETKEGLILLYDFMQQYPEADVDPFLKKCSTFFQDYIKDGLKSIEDDRKSSRNTIAEKVVEKVQASIMPSNPVNNSEKGAEFWRGQLRTWEMKYHGSGGYTNPMNE